MDVETQPFARDARRSMRRKIIGAFLLGAISIGASALSCIGQSFSYRQAKALESIEHALEQGCKR